MTRGPEEARLPEDLRALVAVDLGAESCRVSLLRWAEGCPRISLVHRFGNAPQETAGGLRWDLVRMEAGLEEGVRRCAQMATEGVRSIAVDGWAVDYVRLGPDGRALEDPFCYRDLRTVEAERSLHDRCRPERMRELTGVQLLRINTVYQRHADVLMGLPAGQGWLNLPEYMLSRWGGSRVAELTNATHTQMVELRTREWSREIFGAAGIEVDTAPRIVSPGTCLGRLRGELAELPALRDTVLITPACHDTASAVAGIPATGDDWAYISSGTWSLVGTVLREPCVDAAAAEENFTNLGAVGGRICFHKNVNGMWLLQQCIAAWALAGHAWTVAELVAAAETARAPDGVLEVDADDLLLPGQMPERINAQRRRMGFEALDESPESAPVFAGLIFRSLARRYAEVLGRVETHSRKQLRRVFIVGGGRRNALLNRLTREATGLEVVCGSAESSTIGNFAVQLAALEGSGGERNGVPAEDVSAWARVLADAAVESRPETSTLGAAW